MKIAHISIKQSPTMKYISSTCMTVHMYPLLNVGAMFTNLETSY